MNSLGWGFPDNLERHPSLSSPQRVAAVVKVVFRSTDRRQTEQRKKSTPHRTIAFVQNMIPNQLHKFFTIHAISFRAQQKLLGVMLRSAHNATITNNNCSISGIARDYTDHMSTNVICNKQDCVSTTVVSSSDSWLDADVEVMLSLSEKNLLNSNRSMQSWLTFTTAAELLKQDAKLSPQEPAFLSKKLKT